MKNVEIMKQDTKHLSWIHSDSGLDESVSEKAAKVADKLHGVEGEQVEAAQGAEILIRSSVLEMYCSESPEEYDVEGLEVSIVLILKKMYFPYSYLSGLHRCCQQTVLDEKIQEVQEIYQQRGWRRNSSDTCGCSDRYDHWLPRKIDRSDEDCG
jgi:hypothetical protein